MMRQQHLARGRRSHGSDKHPVRCGSMAAQLFQPGLLSVACLVALLGASGARAVVSLPDITTNVTSPTTLPVVLNQGYWTDYSQTCFFAGSGSGSPPTFCNGSQPEPNPNANVGDPDALLFSWGDYDAFDAGKSLNSFLRVEYSGDTSAPDSFTLDTLQFVSRSDALGPPNTSGNNPANQNYTAHKGLGTMLAYEEAGSPNLLGDGVGNNPHHITDQLVAIRVLRPGLTQPVYEVRDWMVARPESQAGQKDSDTDFFDGARNGFPDYRFVGDSLNPAEGKTFFFTSTDVAEATDANKTPVTIEPGDILEFQFYEASDCGVSGNESCWNNESSSINDVRRPPDAYYGSFDLILNPAESEPEEPELDDPLSIPTLGSYGLGLLTLLMLVLGVAWRSRTA